MKSFWLRAAAVVAAILVASLFGLYLYLDAIVGRAVERGASYALGVDTRVGFARIGLLAGSFGLGGLEVANPPGFEEPRFLGLREAQLDVDMETLREPTVNVPRLAIRGIEVDLDKQQRKANYQVILDNLARFETKEAAPAPEPGQGAGKRFLVHEIVIRDVEAHVRVVEAGGVGKLDVVVPEVRVQNLGAADRPLTLAELSGVVVKAVLASIAKAGAGLPGGVANALSSGLGRLSDVSLELPEGGKLLDEAGGAVKAGADAASRARDAGRSAGEGAGRKLKGLGGRLRGED
jgi:hypothetical protein